MRPVTDDELSDGCAVVVVIAFFALVALVCLGARWYKASCQAEVYQREGIEISTWEVLWGAKPAEQTIHVK